MDIILETYPSPVGELVLGDYCGKLCMCDWAFGANHDAIIRALVRLLHSETVAGSSPVIALAAAQLDEYFRGERRSFSVPLLITGTDFQRKVREELIHIPFGSTRAYSEVATAIGNRAGVRAVAAAIASNPLSIFVPCHRVIGSTGALTGYAGGLRAKRALLQLEGFLT